MLGSGKKRKCNPGHYWENNRGESHDVILMLLYAVLPLHPNRTERSWKHS